MIDQETILQLIIASMSLGLIFGLVFGILKLCIKGRSEY